MATISPSTLCTDSLDCENRRRHDQQHLEAGLPGGSTQIQQVSAASASITIRIQLDTDRIRWSRTESRFFSWESIIDEKVCM
jgi:hypothetical protein